MMDFKESFQNYQNILASLKTRCEEAEKSKIAAEANIKVYKKQRDDLIAECEQYAGTSIDNIPELLQQKEEELNEIMGELSTIDFNTRMVTEQDVSKVEAIMQKHQILPAEV